MRIEAAVSNDGFSQICELAAQIWEPTYGHILSKEQLDYMFEHTYSLENITRQIAEGQFFYIIYDDMGVAKGFASWSWTIKGVYAKLNKIYVLPSTQGTGVGRELLAFVEKTTAAQHATALWLCVNRFNKAKRFYEKLGYIVLREEDFEFGPYFMNDYVLEKRLI